MAFPRAARVPAIHFDPTIRRKPSVARWVQMANNLGVKRLVCIWTLARIERCTTGLGSGWVSRPTRRA